MKANLSTRTDTPTRRGSRVRLAAVAAIGVFVLGACESYPGPRRVALDIIEAEFNAQNLTDEQANCMLTKIKDGYSDADLANIASAISGDEAESDNADLKKYRDDLAACRN